MITLYDYLIVSVYLIFILSLGVVFRRLNKNTSDYFRCGGAMPWWITGTSAWIAGFTAWTFVGAAGSIYRTGYVTLIVFYASFPAFLFLFLFTCKRFRRLRVITWMEAVRERFGPFTEQFYIWIKVPFQLFAAAMGLMAISIFMAAILKVPVYSVQIILGLVITLVAFTGGAFAVLASDFVQMFLVMTITIVTALLTLAQPEIGGLHGLFSKLSIDHHSHIYWWDTFRMGILIPYGLAFVWVKISEQNSLEYATMYLMSKSDQHARRMVIIPLIGSLVGPLIWTIPPLAAVLLFSKADMVAFAGGRIPEPTDTAFIMVAMRVMPVGLLGLLLCAMFGATLTNMDAGVNKCVGVFIRSFYRPILNPLASEKHLLIAGKVGTLAFGVIIILMSIIVASFQTGDLFSFMNQIGVSLVTPLTLPIFFGIFYKNTPPWSAPITALACFAFVLWTNFAFSGLVKSDPLFLTHLPLSLQQLLGNVGRPLSGDEANSFILMITVIGTTLIGTLTFFGSSFFYTGSSPAHIARVEQLFNKMRTPVEISAEAALSDEPIYNLLGMLCIFYGCFILLLMVIPNTFAGRLSFLFIGGVIFIGGSILVAISRHKRCLVLQYGRK